MSYDFSLLYIHLLIILYLHYILESKKQTKNLQTAKCDKKKGNFLNIAMKFLCFGSYKI